MIHLSILIQFFGQLQKSVGISSTLCVQVSNHSWRKHIPILGLTAYVVRDSTELQSSLSGAHAATVTSISTWAVDDENINYIIVAALAVKFQNFLGGSKKTNRG